MFWIGRGAKIVIERFAAERPDDLREVFEVFSQYSSSSPPPFGKASSRWAALAGPTRVRFGAESTRRIDIPVTSPGDPGDREKRPAFETRSPLFDGRCRTSVPCLKHRVNAVNAP